MPVGSLSNLEQKIDMVVTMLQDIYTKIDQQKVPPATKTASDVSVLVNELSTDESLQVNISCVDWSKIENIIQLTEEVKSLRFFSGAENCKTGCVRCKLCFEYLCLPDNNLKKHDPMRVGEDGCSIASHIKK